MKYSLSIVACAALLLGIAGGFAWSGNVADAQANTPPTVVSVVTSNTTNGTTDNFPGGSINVVSGGVKTVYVNGLVEDLDGQNTITNVRGVFYRSGATGGTACTASGNDCAVVASCGLVNDTNVNRKVYSCRMDLQYYSDSTDASGRYPTENWVAHVEVTDGTDTGSDSALTKEMNSILSLNFSGDIAFGNHDIGDVTTSANNVEYPIAQSGNVNADVEVSMPSGMACTSGSIAAGNLKWALTDVGFASGSATALTNSPVDTNLDVAYGTDASPGPSKFLYVNISIPSAIGGTCSGTTVISAISH